MRVSISTCREQEALQLAKASSETLESRRGIALNTAKVWGEKADALEQRLPR